MAEKKITQLNPASVPLDGTEQVEIVQGGFSVRTSTASIANALTAVVPATKGGTGLTTYAVGDLVYADTSSTLARLADVASGSVLLSGGVGVAPAWGKVGLTTHVSGVLPAANGGTGLSAYTIGDLVYADSSTSLAKLAGVATGNVLRSGGVGAAPAWGKVNVATDITGTASVPNGGTGAATLTGYVKGNGTSAMTASATIPYADITGRAYLQAYSTGDQTGSISAATAVLFPTTDAGFSQGISVTQNGSGDHTRVTFAVAGFYMVATSLQINNSDAADHDVTIWLRQNGTNIGNSATIVTIPKAGDGGNGFFQILYYVKTTNPNEYVEVMWLPENTGVTLQYYVSGAIAPAVPSAIVVAERIA